MKLAIAVTTALLAAASSAFAADGTTAPATPDAAQLKSQHVKDLATCNQLTGKERNNCIHDEQSKYDKVMKTAHGDRHAPAASEPSTSDRAAAEATHVH